MNTYENNTSSKNTHGGTFNQELTVTKYLKTLVWLYVKDCAQDGPSHNRLKEIEYIASLMGIYSKRLTKSLAFECPDHMAIENHGQIRIETFF